MAFKELFPSMDVTQARRKMRNSSFRAVTDI
ncbi:hypothetical protein PITC_004680 [Penicillium italicum]|uniref:Uncharacterized protein n=1 Tax=Penicillium italicum TaxID=40296 RepID=A0A0A2LAE2_PENIT|nr:hypothetical protein PITC_004680 [Penicillium italicum]